jgi:hypothetical protein
MIEVTQLLDRSVDVLRSFCADEDERAAFEAILEPLTYGQLLDLVTLQTVELLRGIVAKPERMILTLN